MKNLIILISILTSQLATADIICTSNPAQAFLQTKTHLKKNAAGTYDFIFTSYTEFTPGKPSDETYEVLATKLNCKFEEKIPLLASCDKNPFVDNDKINSYYSSEIRTETYLNEWKKLQTNVIYRINVLSPITVADDFKKHNFERNRTFVIEYNPNDCKRIE
jgi:hypothetical protein